MYPVPLHARQMIGEWAEALARRFGVTVDEVTGPSTRWLSFPAGSLRVELVDGSVVEFQCAFFLVSEEKKAIAVFTEHCGHHAFPYHDAKVFAGGVRVYEQSERR